MAATATVVEDVCLRQTVANNSTQLSADVKKINKNCSTLYEHKSAKHMNYVVRMNWERDETKILFKHFPAASGFVKSVQLSTLLGRCGRVDMVIATNRVNTKNKISMLI